MAKAKKFNRANFGSVRQLASGRWQARYPDEQGIPMNGPRTFETSDEAWTHIAEVKTQRNRNVYTDYRKGERLLVDYAREWIENGGSRGRLAVRTRDLYSDIIERQIAPSIGKMAIGSITKATVRSWYTATSKELAKRAAEPRKNGKERTATGATRLRQSYTLLKSIMNTALGDGLIGVNPCAISGAGTAASPKRQFMSVQEFALILAAHPERLRAPLLLAVTAHLRPGELVALERRDLDLVAGTLTIERQHVKPRYDAVQVTETKTGTERTIDLPDIALSTMRSYLAARPKALPRTPLFTREDGSALTVHGLEQQWVKARERVGLPQHTLYSTKHTGLTLAAQRGATGEELMAIAGHKTRAAADAYQLFAKERGRVIADGLDAALEPLKSLDI